MGIGSLQIPRPVVGVEHEHNIAARLPSWERRMPDAACIDVLLHAVKQMGGRPARGRFSRSDYDPCDRGRFVLPGPSGLLVHIYDDLCKLEVSLGEFTSARGLLAVEQRYADVAGSAYRAEHTEFAVVARK